jgi:hypothetical protein
VENVNTEALPYLKTATVLDDESRSVAIAASKMTEGGRNCDVEDKLKRIAAAEASVKNAKLKIPQ